MARASKKKRRKMFEIGSRAAARVRPEWSGRYVCPLCLTDFGPEAVEDGTLTIEHVPPRSLGGRGLVLTCKTCNNVCGTALDAAMERFHRTITFGTPHTSGVLKGVMKVGDVEQRAEFRADGEGWLVMGIPMMNHPDVPEAMTRALEDMGSDAKFNFSFQFNVNDERLAKIGWTRAAYLAAFASCGYAAILTPGFEILRRQFADADANLVDWRFVNVNPDRDKGEKYLVELEEPTFLNEALLVVHGWYSTFLPPMNDDGTFYERVAKEFEAQPKFQFRGHRFEWPTSMELTLDVADA